MSKAKLESRYIEERLHVTESPEVRVAADRAAGSRFAASRAAPIKVISDCALRSPPFITPEATYASQ